MPRRSHELPWWINAAVVGGAVVTLLMLEKRRPLRRQVEPKGTHDVRNVALSGLSAATVQLVERPIVMPLAERVEQRRLGLLNQMTLPAAVELPAAVLLLDYTLYLWHVLTHRVPFLWRFHQPHHVDLDCTATTALRFHAGEIALSVLWRMAQVRLIGVSPRSLSVWQLFTLVEILFHHSNVRLPAEVERKLAWLLVTPRLHGIHHSQIEAETNSNWSSGFTFWDRLHGTFRDDVPQDTIRIGVPAFPSPEDVNFATVVALPFGEQPESFPEGTQVREMLPAK